MARSRSRLRRRMLLLAPSVLLVGLATTACTPNDCDPAVYVRGADLSGTDQTGKRLHACDLSQLDLADADFTDAHLSSVDLRGTVLDGADLQNVNLGAADLRGASIEGTELAGATLALTRSGPTTGTPASLPVGWQDVGGYLLGPFAQVEEAGDALVGAPLGGSDLTGAVIADSDLHGASFVGARLVSARLYLADLSGADLRDAEIADLDLEGTVLDGADLTGATGMPRHADQASFASTTCPTGVSTDLAPACDGQWLG